MTIIKECDCKHKFQDEKYGTGKRVCNLSGLKMMVRCTVCSKEKNLG